LQCFKKTQQNWRNAVYVEKYKALQEQPKEKWVFGTNHNIF